MVIMGDSNITPENFMTTTLGQHMRVQVIVTGEEIFYMGSELDWALISIQLAADLEGQTNWCVPFKPYAMLQY